ncbi:MAG: aminotransferase class I/II-fold pyridoxal phosphate-dependent enzyme, partial [Pseudomonadota bacterium]
MAFPERFSNLPDYAFPRLRALLDGHASGADDPVEMTIGTPMHAYPHWIRDILIDNIDGFRGYPPNDGTPGLLSSITGWIARRYDAELDPATRVMALNGTREGLYNAAMALGVEKKKGRTPVVLTPNPFYPAYAMAALSIGAHPIFVPATLETGFLPDFETLDAEILNRTTLVYFCSPSNPQGAVAGWDYWTRLFALAETYDFKVFADECYSEIYRKTPPPGALEVAARKGIDPERVVAFHSLSKRSNLAGLRSGFVASGPENIRRIKKQRAYSGCPLPLPIQKVSQKVWSDEDH